MKQKKGATNILYGMDSGALSSVTVLPDGTHTHQWTVEDPIKRSQITCMYCTCSICISYPICIISLTHKHKHTHKYAHTYTHTHTTPGLKLFDLTKDGVEEIIVGRDDGRLDIYGQDTGMNKKTSLLFSKDIGKSRDKSVDMYLQPSCIVPT